MSSEGADERLEEVEEIDDLEDLDIEDATEQAAVPEIDEGRYLYCLVRVDDGVSTDDCDGTDRDRDETGGVDRDASDVALETTGVDNEPVSVVAADGIGAVVHACEGIYDSADLAQIRRWLVRHQTVVDEAGEAFGTPIPFQFDTILRGDDAGVRAWLREEADTLERALSELASHWEYRIELVEVDPIDDETLVERDDRLTDLAGQIDDAEEGTAFLLEKQFDQRLTQLRAARRESISADLQDRLAEHAREVHALERSPTASLSDAVSDGDDGDGETLCRLTLLAHEDDEGAIGSVLDDVAATDGLEVRFTGPWPPYTFAPELGEGDDSATTTPEP